MQKALRFILFFLPFLYGSIGYTQESSANFVRNEGQWQDNIDYKVSLNSGDIYFEKECVTYSIYDKSLYGAAKHGKYDKEYIPGHVYRTTFVNARPDARYINGKEKKQYFNYFIGNDSDKWRSEVKAYNEVYVKSIYEGIDYTFYEFYGKMKYDFIVHPEGNPDDILIKYDGLDNMRIKKGHLVLETSIGDIIEQSPYAYQQIEGKEVQVKCTYKLRNDLLYFDFPEGYDKSLELIIDPVLTFSTYTGSSADNFGCTATDDLSGNMFVGGTVFSFGYPTTTGAYQVSFKGGSIDMAITKYTADGTSLLYSTYLGGSGNEIPHSIVCSSNNELIILGTSNSVNYPTSTNGFSHSMKGGTATNYSGYGFNYPSGCDMVVTKLNPTGTGIVGSTFLGGSGNDGLNLNSVLKYNYGDVFRGEVINGLNDEIIIASTTSSPDFPGTSGAPQDTLNGASDAILVRMNSDLSSVLFASYIGGSNRETGNSVQINDVGDIYITGGTLSTDFPGTSGGFNSTYQGGDSDGYVAKFSANGSSFLGASYIGTNEYDQNFFVQIDNDQEVYVIGQTNGTYPILNAGFSNPNSGQYIQKLSADLSTSLLSTTIGSGSGFVDISISAFLVSECDFIYLSGWGGPLNGWTGLGLATNSSTSGMPVTSDAFQGNTDGEDFYLAVLAPDASSLLYGTFFGGLTSEEHVDGGTSRFDKSGTVYQAVCAGCGGNSDFPTTAGAWSNTNNSSNCNLGAFKFDLGSITPALSVPQPYVCIPSAFQFNNNSSGGNEYLWYFGDGDSSFLYAPSHTYTDTGHYEVKLIVSDTTECLVSDTTSLFIDVFALDNATVGIVDTICQGDSAVLTSAGGATYQWYPPTGLSNVTGATTYAFPYVTTEYTVVAKDSCGLDTAKITVPVYLDFYSTMPDTSICSGDQVTLSANGGVSYSWHNDPSLQNPGSQSPTAIPDSSKMYYVDITMPNGCLHTDSVWIEVVDNTPSPILSNDTTICKGDQITIIAQGADSYSWSPAGLLTNISGGSAQTNIQSTSDIIVEFSNLCGTAYDTVTIEVIDMIPSASPDMVICPGDVAMLWASGGSTYSWTPSSSLTSSNTDTTFASPIEPTIYEVTIESAEGCQETLEVIVDIFPPPTVNASGPSFVVSGQEIELEGTTNGISYYWEDQDSIICVDCYNAIVRPETTSTYYFTAVDSNNCSAIDSIEIVVEGSLYVPNTITPNGDGINDYFKVIARDVHDYHLYLFNRWGQLIFETTNTEATWDATYKGSRVIVDAYVWKIDYLDDLNERHEFRGHVNVIW